MSGPIWYEGDETTVRSAGGMALVQQFADLLNHGQVGLLVVPADIVLINFFGLAIRLRLKTRDLKHMVSAYPTAGSDLGSLL